MSESIYESHYYQLLHCKYINILMRTKDTVNLHNVVTVIPIHSVHAQNVLSLPLSLFTHTSLKADHLQTLRGCSFLKGLVHEKWHHLLTLKFQTCISFFLLLNTTDNIFQNVGNQMLLVAIDFHFICFSFLWQSVATRNFLVSTFFKGVIGCKIHFTSSLNINVCWKCVYTSIL